MARKILDAITTAASLMFRQVSRKPSRISNRRLHMAANCPAYGRGRCCSLANLAADFSPCTYAGLKPSEVMGVVNFSGGWYPYGPVTTPYYANAGRGAADKVPQLWLYADNDRLYDEALIREYDQAFVAAGGSARFELLHGVPGDGHLLRLYPDRWRPIADQFLATLDRQRP